MSAEVSYKKHFRRFLEADPERLHFAAHSHHYWPDVTFEAQQDCWRDAARLVDRKWTQVLGEVVPEVQGLIARHLGLDDPATLTFAPNTHDFLRRLLSCLPPGRPPRILTSDGEFHSFARQTARLEEDGLVAMTRVPVEPFADFAARFAAAARDGDHDLIFFSQVFFNSGFALLDLDALVARLPAQPLLVIDGYHGFLARPSDLGGIASRAFYMSGGYKYAMAGEGVCFLHAPPGIAPRPRDTGWYAAFGALEQAAGGGGVAYAADARRFLGATFDPSGLYRLRAVLRLLDGIGVDAAAIHAHARALQDRFLAGLRARPARLLPPERLLVDPQALPCGNFLTFDLGSEAAAEAAHARLRAAEVVTDFRGTRLRIGFGLYQDTADVAALLKRLAAL